MSREYNPGGLYSNRGGTAGKPRPYYRNGDFFIIESVVDEGGS